MKTAHEAIAAMKAELERRISNISELGIDLHIETDFPEEFRLLCGYRSLLSFLDTIEAETTPEKLVLKNELTGEVVDNFGISKEYGTVSYTDKNGILTVSTAASGEWEIIDDQEGSVDWRAFRREAAKNILTGIVSSGNYQECTGKERVRIAIDYANALIEKLKEDKK